MSGDSMPGNHRPTGGPEPIGEVDRFLDAAFDELAGTGVTGRRALAEIEDHLRTAVEYAVAEGADPAQAERDAVARFGSVPDVVGGLRREHRPGRLGVALSSAWLVVGLAAMAVALAVAGTEASGLVSPSGATMCLQSPGCARPAEPGLTSIAVPAGLAVLMLVGYGVARRRFGLPASGRRLPARLAVVSAVLAPILLWGIGFDPFMLDYRLGFGATSGLFFNVVAAGIAVLGALACTGWAVVRLRRTGNRRYRAGLAGAYR